MSVEPIPGSAAGPPRVPASAGALILDPSGRLLILKPVYKKGWTIPGGQLEASGESPWEACRRETLEECGLEVKRGRLVCVDFRPPRPERPDRPGGLRFLFHCGTFNERQLHGLRLQEDEISAYRLADLTEATSLLSGPVRRRVVAGIDASHCVYLEDGRPVPAVRD